MYVSNFSNGVGREILGPQFSEVDMYFRGGPLFLSKACTHLSTGAEVPAARVLATYASEMAEKNK